MSYYVHPHAATITYLSSDNCVQFYSPLSWKYSQLFQFFNEIFYLELRLKYCQNFTRL